MFRVPIKLSSRFAGSEALLLSLITPQTNRSIAHNGPKLFHRAHFHVTSFTFWETFGLGRRICINSPTPIPRLHPYFIKQRAIDKPPFMFRWMPRIWMALVGANGRWSLSNPFKHEPFATEAVTHHKTTKAIHQG